MDTVFMYRAVGLAKRAWGETHPNPMVGAVIVESGEVVAEGWHHRVGEPHAEVEALRALGRKPSEDAVLYVTMEPCSTPGRTGACTDLVIASGLRKVVVGTIDPYSGHAGRGIEILRNAGIEVVAGVREDVCKGLNLIFNHWIVKQRPFVAMKVALTLDGKFTGSIGHSKYVTGELARADVMRWRRYFPAIAVGAGTALADDPNLTSRIDDDIWCPRRFVLDRTLKTADVDLTVFTDAYASKTTVVCGHLANTDLQARLQDKGVSVWVIPERDGHMDWAKFMERLTEETICGLYIEAGPRLASALLGFKLADYAFVYRAPKFLNDINARGIGLDHSPYSEAQAFELTEVEHAGFGADSLTRGWL